MEFIIVQNLLRMRWKGFLTWLQKSKLKLNTTLSIMLTMKLVDLSDCIKYEPTKSVVDTAKKAQEQKRL